MRGRLRLQPPGGERLPGARARPGAAARAGAGGRRPAAAGPAPPRLHLGPPRGARHRLPHQRPGAPPRRAHPARSASCAWRRPTWRAREQIEAAGDRPSWGWRRPRSARCCSGGRCGEPRPAPRGGGLRRLLVPGHRRPPGGPAGGRPRPLPPEGEAPAAAGGGPLPGAGHHLRRRRPRAGGVDPGGVGVGRPRGGGRPAGHRPRRRPGRPRRRRRRSRAQPRRPRARASSGWPAGSTRRWRGRWPR